MAALHCPLPAQLLSEGVPEGDGGHDRKPEGGRPGHPEGDHGGAGSGLRRSVPGLVSEGCSGCLEAGLDEALTYTEFLCRNFSTSQHRHIRATNGLEQLFSSAALRESSVLRGEAPNGARRRLPQSTERGDLSLAVMLRVFEGGPRGATWTWSHYTLFSTNSHNR